jgi:hypothetical protein
MSVLDKYVTKDGVAAQLPPDLADVINHMEQRANPGSAIVSDAIKRCVRDGVFSTEDDAMMYYRSVVGSNAMVVLPTEIRPLMKLIRAWKHNVPLANLHLARAIAESSVEDTKLFEVYIW